MKRKIDQFRWNPDMKQMEVYQIEIPIKDESEQSEKTEAKSQKPKTKNEKKWELTDGRDRGIPD